jgi:hypothetical protein
MNNHYLSWLIIERAKLSKTLDTENTFLKTLYESKREANKQPFKGSESTMVILRYQKMIKKSKKKIEQLTESIEILQKEIATFE